MASIRVVGLSSVRLINAPGWTSAKTVVLVVKNKLAATIKDTAAQRGIKRDFITIVSDYALTFSKHIAFS